MAVQNRQRAVQNAAQTQSPTKSQKLIYIADKLGIPALKQMQGSTFNIFDTVLLATNTAYNTIEFFANTTQKPLQFTNMQAGTLSAGEALVMEDITFLLLQLSAATLADATSIVDIKAISEVAGTGIVSNPGALKFAQCEISIANQVVVRKFNIFETNPQFNPRTTGSESPILSTAGSPFTTFGTTGQNKIPLEANPVLPPNLRVSVKLSMAAIGTLTGNWAICCVLGRFGSIFSAKTNM